MILFLNILKFIGFLLLILLFLILLAVIFILFVPIKYSIFVEKYDTIKVKSKIVCLFNIIKYEYLYYCDSQTDSLKVFGFELKNRNNKKRKKKESNLIKNNNKKEIKKNLYSETSKDIKNNNYKNKKIDTNENNSYNNKIHNKSNNKIKNKINPDKKHTLNLKEKYLYLKNYPDKKKIFNIIKKLILRLFRAVKHKKLNLKVKFGFEEPYLTGCVLGLVDFILAFLPFNFDIKGEFEKEIINFEFKTKGVFNLFSVLFPVLIFVLSKPIWKIIRRKDVINE